MKVRVRGKVLKITFTSYPSDLLATWIREEKEVGRKTWINTTKIILPIQCNVCNMVNNSSYFKNWWNKHTKLLEIFIPNEKSIDCQLTFCLSEIVIPFKGPSSPLSILQLLTQNQWTPFTRETKLTGSQAWLKQRGRGETKRSHF